MLCIRNFTENPDRCPQCFLLILGSLKRGRRSQAKAPSSLIPDVTDQGQSAADDLGPEDATAGLYQAGDCTRVRGIGQPIEPQLPTQSPGTG